MLNTSASLSQRAVRCRRPGIDLWHDSVPVHPALPPREDRDLPPGPGGQSLRRAHPADRRLAARRPRHDTGLLAARRAARRPRGRSRCTPPTTAPTCPGDLVAGRGGPGVRRRWRSTRRTSGCEASLAMFSEVFGRQSYDDRGAEVVATVHYEKDYDNAFWDGTQLVFGDGDGTVFGRFTKPVDVLGHELTPRGHPVHRRPDLPGPVGRAQRVGVRRVRLLPQAAAARPVGRRGGLADRRGHLPAVGAGQGAALDGAARHGLRRPGARQGPAGRRRWTTTSTPSEDNGGVHTNSGIPNKAFHLAATAIGGKAWEGAGQDLVRRADLGDRRGHRLRRVRRRHRHRGGGGLARRPPTRCERPGRRSASRAPRGRRRRRPATPAASDGSR